jgi:F0F1-type ATP synthase epsilon subunit
MNTFPLIISGIHKTYFKGKAISMQLSTNDGCLGIEARHENILGILRASSIVTYKKEDGSSETIKIKDGIFSFVNNVGLITLTPEQ